MSERLLDDERAFEQADVDVLTDAVSLACEEREHDALHREKAAGHVHDRERDLDGVAPAAPSGDSASSRPSTLIMPDTA